MCKFRDLRADEIEVRIGQASEKGVQLLLYKDARVDMSILDETVGSLNWQREHYECKGNLFCRVAINANHNKLDEPPLWIWKSDCGSESNTEAEKGEASDSFKRSCVNWGIGRELYTAPFIWCAATECKITMDGKRAKCYDKFKVASITITDKKITALTVVNESNNKTVYTYPKAQRSTPPIQPPVPPEQPQASLDPGLAQKREWASCYKIDVGDFRGFTLTYLRKNNKAAYNALKAAPPSEEIAVAIQIIDDWVAESARSAQ